MVVILISQVIASHDYEETQKQQIIILIKWTDSNQTLPLTPISSFGLPVTVTISMGISAGQPVMPSQVPNQVMTNPSLNATNLSETILVLSRVPVAFPLIMSGCDSDWRVDLATV